MVQAVAAVAPMAHHPGTTTDMCTSVTTTIRSAAIVALATVLMIFTSASPAAAHEADDGVVVVVDDHMVVITAAVAYEQLGFADTTGDGLLDADELAAQQVVVAPSLVATVRDHVALTVDGETTEIIGAGVPALSQNETDTDASAHVVLVLATSAHDGEVSDLGLAWTLDIPSTNVVLSDASDVITSDLSSDGTVEFSLSTWSSARSFFELGVDHIRYGPDHLLFLLVLTLTVAGPSITATTTRRTVKLVTAFTIGHAMSLGLAYFDLVSVPAAIVEPAISLSIVAAAVLALRGTAAEARPFLAGLVGVVHGLGFASNLDSLGVAASQRIAALAAFNVGVDVAQTVVVLVVIAGLWVSGQVLADRARWVRVAAAIGAGLFGLAWTASRLADFPT